MELHPTSKLSTLSFLDQRGSPIPNLQEWMTGWIELHDVLHEWDAVHLMRQGSEELSISLKRFGDQKRVVAEWPLSGPGRYHLQMFIHDVLVSEQIVIIQPSKISTDAYGKLLEDLETLLPATIALALQRGGALTGLSFLPPSESTLAMELIRLKRAILSTKERSGLAQVLHALAQSPHQILHTTESWVLLERARRPHPSRLMQALSKPYNLSENGKPVRVFDTCVEHSVDVYENRLLKVFWQSVYLRLRRLRSVLIMQSSKNVLLEVQVLSEVLKTARREAAFLDDVTLPSYLPTQVTMVLLRNPLYRAALEGYLEFYRSPMVRLEEPFLTAPLENLPFLYQVWGTLQVLNALLDVAVDLGYKVQDQRLARKDVQGIYLRLLPDGKPLVTLEHPIHRTIIKIIPERTYTRSHASKHEAFHSLSFEQRPDIAVEIQTLDGSSRMYLFDPKYKLSRGYEEGEATPKKEDIDKMHAYRDAIRDRGQQRVVQYAAILYPGPTQSYGDGIEALQAYPSPSMELQLLLQLKSIFLTALQD